MKISYNWLKEYVKNLPKPEKLAELLTMHSFEVEGIEKVSNDYVLDVDILPNRAHDCLSHIGIAREVAALTDSKLQVTSYELRESKLRAEDFIGVKIEDTELCSRYTARVITDIKVGPSPKWLRERLEAVGQQSINNIVDATNYVALEIGQPLHAFDAEKLTGKKIIVRRAKKGEKITTLDNEKCDLDNDVLIIADSKDPIAIAGIKGGKKAEIDKNTKTIILESANFNLHNIHKSSRKLGIATESSLRFEHGLDPNLASEAIDRLAGLIQGISGGKTAKGMIDIYPNKIKSRKIGIGLFKINSLLGLKISEREVIRIFNLLGFKVEKKVDRLLVEVPTRRLDIEIPEDLIEEVGRIYEYEKISSKPPIGILASAKPDDLLKIRNKVKDILDGLGLIEVYNYSFVGEEDLKKLKISPKDYIELENPLSLDLKYLRRDLIINLLKNVRENFKYFGEVRLFELGKVYLNTEKMMLAGVLGRKTGGDRLFYEAKGVVDGLLNKLGITGQWYDSFQATPEKTNKIFWNSSRSAEIKINNKEVGFIGEINPEILSKFGTKEQAVVFNLDFEPLIKLISEELIYQHPSKYPAVIRDIAVLVNLGDRVVDVLNVINSVGGELVRDVDLFDMYEGGELPRAKKNLAFHIVYQSDEKTLIDEEVDKVHNRIVKEVSKGRGWEVRK
jgi:phenylalanyl-tRNA synthetase beta chain